MILLVTSSEALGRVEK